jgi:hypothetical protein
VLREIDVPLSPEARHDDAAIEAVRRQILALDLPGLRLAG